MNLNRVCKINNITFTTREIDIISCILNIRGVKKIADILAISPRTVEGYIKNILIKTSLNSQEGIKDFVEKSSKLALIKQHYVDLLINKLFLAQISKIAVKLKNANISCVVNYAANEKLQYIVDCLKQANITVILEKSNQAANSDQKIITILTEKQLLKLKQDNQYQRSIFICFDKKLYDKVLSDFSEVQVIGCLQQDQIYLSIFRIIELLASNIDLQHYILDFNKQKNDIINQKINLTTELLNKEQEVEKPLADNRSITLTIFKLIVIIAILLISFYIYNYQPLANISVNFLLPNEKLLLTRKEITEQLDKIFAKPNEINTVILVGGGGVGKTTIARSYANKQKASIIWEINAETKNSLFLSLESLAYALCKNNTDKQELRSILDIKDYSVKDKQLLLFVQQQLKLLPNWLIIYDNLESFKDIWEYFPQNANSWGKGRVIITTRDATIKNSEYIDTLNVIAISEINEQEKLQLFNNIAQNSLPQLTKNQKRIAQFLADIPSFPLDVSIAAHYLRDTGMNYNQYLEEIKAPKKEFSELQISILQDVNQYAKTRYNIVSLTLQKMIKSNAEFYDLALLIAIVDSQNIPEELLVLYKKQYIATDFLRGLKKNSLVTNIQYKDDDKTDINNLASFSIHRSTQMNMLAAIIGSADAQQKQETLSAIMSNIQSYILQQIDLENTSCLKNFIRHYEALLSKQQNLLNRANIISINNGLGIINYYLGHDQQAREMLEANLDITKQNQDTALVLTHLGAIYRKIGQNYPIAIDYLKQAIAIYQAISPDDVRQGLAFTHLGNTYRTLGDFQKATAALEKSVSIYRQHSGYDAGEARALGYLGVAYREQGDLIKAKDLLEQAKSLYDKKKSVKCSSAYAGALAHLGITYRMMGQYDKAKDILEESVDIYQQIRPKNHPDIGRNMLNLGVIYGEIKENIKAEDLLKKSLNDYENNYGVNHIETGKVLNQLGRFYILSKNFKAAEEVIRRACDILQSHSHPEHYRSFELLGDMYKEALDKQAALNKEIVVTHYKKSLTLALKYFPIDSENTRRIQRKINDL